MQQSFNEVPPGTLYPSSPQLASQLRWPVSTNLCETTFLHGSFRYKLDTRLAVWQRADFPLWTIEKLLLNKFQGPTKYFPKRLQCKNKCVYITFGRTPEKAIYSKSYFQLVKVEVEKSARSLRWASNIIEMNRLPPQCCF